jgi:hypothetical protein
LEETLTGKGTTHRVNGIAVQAKVFGPHLPKPSLVNVPKTKQRSIAASNQPLLTYVAGARVGPSPSTSVNQSSQLEESAMEAKQKNLLWAIVRQIDPENQKVPSWAGFNIKVRKLHVSSDTIGYPPTINAPATDLATVSEILKQSDCIRENLNLQSIVVVMDQALYAKACKIVWKHNAKYKHIILRMGVFHTICNFLSILGKRFKDAGLEDICIK